MCGKFIGYLNAEYTQCITYINIWTANFYSHICKYLKASQSVVICLKLKIETIEQGVKSVQS